VPRLHVVRVFCAPGGGGGNALGVFIEGEAVPEPARQGVAAELGFSETVFLDDRRTGELRIFTPGVELPFAGHPLVGTAWLLAQEGEPPSALLPPAGEVRVRREGELTFIAAESGWSPPFEYVEYRSPAEIDALDGAPDGIGEAYCWAWSDEAAGAIRARSFAPAVGITEDEATGSAALALSARLGREIEITQGRGSRLLARPLGRGLAEVGGSVELDEIRDHALPV
jgi:predicted PhzF superfamily epimerase YddE/YHI9